MEALEFSAPYNDDAETLTELFKLKRLGKNKITEIYISGPQKYFGSHRITPEMDVDEFTRVVKRIHGEGLRVNLILNATCGGIEWYSQKTVDSIMDYLKYAHKELGVESVTIANPLYITETKKRFADLEICASVLGNIDCVQRAVIYKKAGADIITPDNNINRDLKLLQQIKEVTGFQLKLMLNEGCLYKCPFRRFHSNATSHLSKDVGKEKGDISFGNFYALCGQLFREDTSQILKSGWIRPEDTRKYAGITNYFKIVGRGDLKSRVVRSIRAYMEEKWSGNLLDILFTSLGFFTAIYSAYLDNEALDTYKFFEKVTSCDKNCVECDYCENLANRLVEFGIGTLEQVEDYECCTAMKPYSRLYGRGEGVAGRDRYHILNGKS